MTAQTQRDVVVVTGASAGVGRAVARLFGKRGAAVGLLARGEAGLKAAKQEIEERGGQALVVPTDVSDPEQVEMAAQAVEREFGPIDIWVNNAMVSVFAPVHEITPEEYQRVTDVTYLGYVYGTQAALRRMRERNQGVIIQVGSALAYRGIPLQSAYCAAKHAVEGFTDSLRAELLHDGCDIHVCQVHLPAVNTPQFGWVRNRLGHHGQPVPPIFQPEMVADAIVWSAYQRRRDVYVGFSAAKAIIGNKIFPLLGDIYLAKTGYESQTTDQKLPADYQDNLWQPLDNTQDQGARGIFTEKSHHSNWYLTMVKNRGPLIAASTGFIALLGMIFSVFQRDPESDQHG